MKMGGAVAITVLGGNVVHTSERLGVVWMPLLAGWSVQTLNKR